MKRILLLLLLVCAPLKAQDESAPEISGEDETGIWYMYFGMNKISERWSLHTEAQFRYYESSGNFNQLLLRTGANYHINSNAIATAGYAFINTDPNFEDFRAFGDIVLDDIRIKEHRIFQQFILKNRVWEFLFEHRYRLEQRFITFGETGDTDFRRSTQHRARYRIQATLPLTNTFFLNFYDEIFLNLQGNTFDQNRLYGAVGMNITENSNIQFGYLKNHFTGRVFDRFQIGFFFNPDLRKKSKS